MSESLGGCCRHPSCHAMMAAVMMVVAIQCGILNRLHSVAAVVCDGGKH